jgi:hypothetical protein
MHHAPCSKDGMPNTVEGIRWNGKSTACFTTHQASSGRVRVPASRLAKTWICDGQMRRTHNVSPQLLAILLWAHECCRPIAVNPGLPPTYQELASITRNDLSNPQHTSNHAVCLVDIFELSAKNGVGSPQASRELVHEPTQHPILHSKLDSKAYRSSLEAQPTPR